MKLRGTSVSFLIAAIVVVAFGVILRHGKLKYAEVWVEGPGSHIARGVSFQAVSCIIAILFAGFACIHAVNLPRLNSAARRIHVWLTLCGTGLLLAGYFGLRAVAIKFVSAGATYHPSQLSLAGVAFCDIFGPLIFLLGQVTFLLAIARALIPSHRRVS